MRRTKCYPLILALLAFLAAGLGCSFSTSFPAPAVAPQVAPPQPQPTPEVCSENRNDLAIQVIFGRMDELGQLIAIKGTGFLPGEKLVVRVKGQGVQHGVETEISNFAVKPDGTFSVDSDLPMDDAVMHWEVHVVHQRGVACLRFDTHR